jgi:hypothetical protein
MAMKIQKKTYRIRAYVLSEEIGLILNDAVDSGVFALEKSFDGANGCLAIYDGKVSHRGLKLLIDLGMRYFPLDHYEDFVITCPNCGERIDDDMVLNVYDETLLSGYNILCDRDGCGTQMAKVEFLNQ